MLRLTYRGEQAVAQADLVVRQALVAGLLDEAGLGLAGAAVTEGTVLVDAPTS